MWPFRKSGDHFSVGAAAACNVLMGATEEGTPHLLEALVGKERVGESEDLLAPIKCELLIFGLHLTDRIAFARLGAGSTSGFMNALLPLIQQELEPAIGAQLEHLYNMRNTFYGGFCKLYPDKEEDLKGTLFWEFGKAMGSVYADSNPVAIMQTSMFGMTFMEAMIETFEESNVFS
ncbi:MAG: hypothetical protein NTW87_36260 [Planctomycetota bacterium]|nr:hypothetical protein [Planctomycetota bacterium]